MLTSHIASVEIAAGGLYDITTMYVENSNCRCRLDCLSMLPSVCATAFAHCNAVSSVSEYEAVAPICMFSCKREPFSKPLDGQKA